jgi:hypothetical protein
MYYLSLLTILLFYWHWLLVLLLRVVTILTEEAVEKNSKKQYDTLHLISDLSIVKNHIRGRPRNAM